MSDTPHHRHVRYRHPRKERDEHGPQPQLFRRFARTYLMPWRLPLALCIVLVCLNANSVYVMAFLMRYVVDNVLLVTDDNAEPGAPERVRRWADDRQPTTRTRPDTGAWRDIPAPRHAPEAERLLLLIFVLHFGTILVLNIADRYANDKRIMIGQNIAADLRNDLHAKVLELSLSYHQRHPPGRILARIMSDVQSVQLELMLTLVHVAAGVSSVIVGAAILILSDWRIALIAFLVTPAYAVVWLRSREPLRVVNLELQHTNSCLWSLASQKLDAIKAIQAYGRANRERLDWHRLAGCYMRDGVSLQTRAALVTQACGLIAAVGTLTAFVYGTRQVLNGDMTLGKMLFLYSATALLFTPVILLASASVLFSRMRVILQRLNDIFDEPVEIADTATAMPFPTPVRRGLSLRNLRYRFDADQDPVLRDVSFDIPAGRWVCVMGPSGCGKTTLLYLLSRLYDPEYGRILVDGVPLPEVAIASLRDHVALVPQEAQIFRGTIRDNIAYGHPDASPKEIMAAAKAAEMHDLIMEMKVKYETLVGEKGTTLSGGQRQRLSLARALLTNPDVLLLDDCTSALDAATEQRIQQTLGHVLEGKTAVIVSQRVSMAKRCHRIVVLDNGVVAEQGTHAELVDSGGFYSRLHAQQTE